MPSIGPRSNGRSCTRSGDRRSRRVVDRRRPNGNFAKVSDAAGPADARDLARWSASLAGIARTGLAFTQNLYERERYEEVLHVAADIKAAADEALAVRREQDHFIQEWMESVGEGVPGYVTPKVAIGAIVGNDDGEILLVDPSGFELTAERCRRGLRPGEDEDS